MCIYMGAMPNERGALRNHMTEDKATMSSLTVGDGISAGA